MIRKDSIIKNLKKTTIPSDLLEFRNDKLREQLLEVYPDKKEDIDKIKYDYVDEEKRSLILLNEISQNVKFSIEINKLKEKGITNEEQLMFYLSNSQKMIEVKYKDKEYFVGDIKIDKDYITYPSDNQNTEVKMFIKAVERNDNNSLDINLKLDDQLKEFNLNRESLDDAEYAKFIYIDPKIKFEIIILLKWDFSDIKLKFNLNLIDNQSGWEINDILYALKVYSSILEGEVYLNKDSKLDITEKYMDRIGLIKNDINNFERIKMLEKKIGVRFLINYPYDLKDYYLSLELFTNLVEEKLVLSPESIGVIFLNKADFNVEKYKNMPMIICDYKEELEITIWNTKFKVSQARYLVGVNYFDYKVKGNDYELLITKENQKKIKSVIQRSITEMDLIRDEEKLLEAKEIVV